MQTTYAGVVYPAQCDSMGHMNVQHYVSVFDQAMWHLVYALGFKPSWVHDRHQGWADVRYVINFQREMCVGQLFRAESTVRKVGNSSLLSFHQITECESGLTAAYVEMTSVYFDLAERRSIPIPEEIRIAAQALAT